MPVTGVGWGAESAGTCQSGSGEAGALAAAAPVSLEITAALAVLSLMSTTTTLEGMLVVDCRLAL
jgi:hypothetical protein